MTTEAYLNLSREDLYELVWSKPMLELAKDLGLSDVGLAKRCRKLGVPVPGRGYWARVAAGQEPHRPKLAKREGRVADEVTLLSFAPVPEESPPAEASNLAPEEAAIRAQIDAMSVPPIPGLECTSPPIQRLARVHKVLLAKDIAWVRQTDRQGPILEIQVSEAQTQRALLIADTVLRAADSLGWPFKAIKPKDTGYRGRVEEKPERLPMGTLLVADEPFTFRMDEPQKRAFHEPTPAEIQRQKKESWFHPPPWDFIWSGDLRLHVHEPDSRYTLHTWKDGKRRRLEDQIHDILKGFYEFALKAKAQRAEHERRERERREQERLERERSTRRDAELKLIHELERQAGAWFRARLLRRYVRSARRVLGEDRIIAQRGKESVDFFAWAEGYLDQLDPLNPAARNADLDARPSWGPDPDFHKDFARLAGFEGQRSCKVAGNVEDPDAESQDEDEDEFVD